MPLIVDANAKPRRMLMVASTGGHLAEIHQLGRKLARPVDSTVWAVPDSVQAESLLAGETVAPVSEVGPRRWGALATALPRALALLLRHRPAIVVSTGAAVALVFLPFAFLVGASAHYVESAARTKGPSLTGRLLSLLPWVRVHTQWAHLRSRRWRYDVSVFEDFAAAAGSVIAPPARAPRILVMLGTSRFPFDRLVAQIQAVLPADAEVIWQRGSTEVPGHPKAPPLLPTEDLARIARSCTAVVTHAGVGSALLALQAGVRPILVPRLAVHGEHVDDHQREVAQELARGKAAVLVEVEDLTAEHLRTDYRFTPSTEPRQRTHDPAR